MIKESITYTDLNGVERTEDFYFDLSKPEIVRMQASEKGGYDVQLKSIASGSNGALIMEFFETFIKSAYELWNSLRHSLSLLMVKKAMMADDS